MPGEGVVKEALAGQGRSVEHPPEQRLLAHLLAAWLEVAKAECDGARVGSFFFSECGEAAGVVAVARAMGFGSAEGECGVFPR